MISLRIAWVNHRVLDPEAASGAQVSPSLAPPGSAPARAGDRPGYFCRWSHCPPTGRSCAFAREQAHLTKRSHGREISCSADADDGLSRVQPVGGTLDLDSVSLAGQSRTTGSTQGNDEEA